MCLRTPPAPRSPPRSTRRQHSCQACQRLLSLSAGRWLPGWPSSPLGRAGPPLAASSPRLCSFPTPLRDRTGAPAVRAGTGGRVTAWPHAPVQGMAWFNSVNAPGRPWGSLYQSPLSQGQTRARAGRGLPQASAGRGTSRRLSTRAWRSATALTAPSSPHAENECRPSTSYWPGRPGCADEARGRPVTWGAPRLSGPVSSLAN